MEFVRATKRSRSLNLTSLIDIIFLLVVFFLLTSEFVTSEVIDLNVSTLEGEESSVSANEAIIVILEPSKKFVISGEKYNLESLKDKIGGLIKDNKNKDIVLISKKGVVVQDMVFAMDQIKSSGGSNISLAGG